MMGIFGLGNVILSNVELDMLASILVVKSNFVWQKDKQSLALDKIKEGKHKRRINEEDN